MIKKFQRIKSLGVFQDFQWDQEVLSRIGQIRDFENINIIYGRNYSGKTTLSRLLRALETHALSNKFEGREFEIIFDDGSVVTQENYTSYTDKVRVFNEDFIRENLRFIIDQNETIEPFALIGDDNVAIQEEIDAIETEIGSDEVGQESGLFADLEAKKSVEKKAKAAHKTAEDTLGSQMKNKATGGKDSIKYNSDKFGDQNYTVRKLQNDIEKMANSKF